MCFILSDLKSYESAASKSTNHLGSVKEKELQKNNKKKKAFQLAKHNSIFLSHWTIFTFKSQNFLNFLFILNDLKCYKSST
jgi:hypothetical protein